MARPVKDALVVCGPVRVQLRADGRYRVLWTEAGRQVERSRPTLSAATELAEAEAARLTDPHSASQPGALFAALVDHYLEPSAHPQWGVRYRAQRDYLARCHLLPALGHRRCEEVTASTVGAWVNDMATRGYARSTIHQALRLCRDVVAHGQDLGAFRAGPHPLRSVGVPKEAVGADTGLHTISASEVPTRELVAALIEALAQFGPQWALLGQMASETGLRWGELAGLHATGVDLAGARLTVTQQLREDDKGVLTLGPPKTRAGLRTVALSPQVTEGLAAHIAQLDGRPGPIFRGGRGGLLRRSGINRRNIGPAMEAAGWPDGLTWHSLRHYAITTWLERLGTGALGDIAKMAGHANPNVTLTRYVGASADYADKMARGLWG